MNTEEIMNINDIMNINEIAIKNGKLVIYEVIRLEFK